MSAAGNDSRSGIMADIVSTSPEITWLETTLQEVEDALSVDQGNSIKVKLVAACGDTHQFRFPMQGTFPQLRAKVFDSTGSMEEAFTGVYYDEDGDSVSLFRDCHFQELLRNSSLWLPRSTMKTKLESLSGRSDNEMNKRWFTEMASSLHGSHRLFISLSDLPERLSSFIFIVDLGSHKEEFLNNSWK
eukprot:353978-Prorocentrum_minimum.AAC.1